MSLETLDSFDQVMDVLGGNRPVAELTASKPSTISMWRKVKGFPSNTHFIMMEALREKGKTAPPSLWGMKEPAAPPLAASDDSAPADEAEVRS